MTGRIPSLGHQSNLTGVMDVFEPTRADVRDRPSQSTICGRHCVPLYAILAEPMLLRSPAGQAPLEDADITPQRVGDCSLRSWRSLGHLGLRPSLGSRCRTAAEAFHPQTPILPSAEGCIVQGNHGERSWAGQWYIWSPLRGLPSILSPFIDTCNHPSKWLAAVFYSAKMRGTIPRRSSIAGFCFCWSPWRGRACSMGSTKGA